MRRAWTLVLPALLTLGGCPRQPPDGRAGGEDAAPAASPAREPIPDPITHPCVVTSAQFDIAFRDGDKSCQTDADCEYIPELVGQKHACGGVTSRKTGAKLRALAREFAKMRCTSTHECDKHVCQPRCQGGQCQ